MSSSARLRSSDAMSCKAYTLDHVCCDVASREGDSAWGYVVYMLLSVHCFAFAPPYQAYILTPMDEQPRQVARRT